MTSEQSVREQPTRETPVNHESRFNGTVRSAEERDLVHLRPILETWVRDRNTKLVVQDEITRILEAVRESARGENDIVYLVAETSEGEVVGMMGLRPPEERMLVYSTTTSPVEIINAFVRQDQRGRGVGHALVNGLEQIARARKHTEIVLNSGPRYKFSGWPSWIRLFGKPIAIAANYYGEGGNAPVWRKELK